MASNLTLRMIQWMFSRSGLKFFLFGFAAVVTLLFVLWNGFNWRQERLWQAVVADHRAHGEPVELKEIVPAAVPDDQNFAMTPLLAPLYAFDPAIPGDFGNGSPERSKLVSGDILRTTGERRNSGSSKVKPPAMGNWRLGELTDLVAWQDYYSAEGSFPHPKIQGRPGADILLALDESKAQIAELEAASRRPHAVFKVHYETDNPAAILLPHLAILKRFNAYCVLSGIAALSEGKPEIAMARVHLSFTMMRAADVEPTLISYLVQIAMWNQISQLVWEGVARHAWKPEQLESLQQELAALHPAKSLVHAMQAERTFGNALYERYIRSPRKLGVEMQGMSEGGNQTPDAFLHAASFVPRGVFRMNQRLQDRFITRCIEGTKALEKTPGSYVISNGELPVFLEDPGVMGPTHPGNLIAKMFTPALQKPPQRAMLAETSHKVMTVAIALERYLQAKKEYPASLDLLQPAFLQTVPLDPFSGKAFQYRRETPPKMVIYSVGWNGRESGGSWPASEKDIEASSPSNRNTPAGKREVNDDIVWGMPKE